jgi:hypothetical protein
MTYISKMEEKCQKNILNMGKNSAKIRSSCEGRKMN